MVRLIHIISEDTYDNLLKSPTNDGVQINKRPSLRINRDLLRGLRRSKAVAKRLGFDSEMFEFHPLTDHMIGYTYKIMDYKIDLLFSFPYINWSILKREAQKSKKTSIWLVNPTLFNYYNGATYSLCIIKNYDELFGINSCESIMTKINDELSKKVGDDIFFRIVTPKY